MQEEGREQDRRNGIDVAKKGGRLCGQASDRTEIQGIGDARVKDAGNIWAVPVIDMNALSGLYPMMDEHAQYFKDADTDRLHPNDKGHERLARTLYYQLSTLPCVLP